MNTHRTSLALWHKSAIMTDHSIGIPFFVHDDSYFFSFSQIFADPSLCQNRKKMLKFLSHVDEENIFFLFIYCMRKLFVIHAFICKKSLGNNQEEKGLKTICKKKKYFYTVLVYFVIIKQCNKKLSSDL